MERNIQLLPYLLPVQHMWLWVGIWLLYYLRFTDYAGIGLLEGSMFFIGFLIEIPTGAISDTLGKKKTLIAAMIISGLGNIFMGMFQSYTGLFISVFTMVLGGALFSGTAEAIVFDSLKTLGKENLYQKILARIERNNLLFLSAASLIGGFLYSVDISLPFYLTGIFMIVAGIVIGLTIKEPPIDSEKFSFKAYLNQNIEGAEHLFSTSLPKTILLSLFLITGFAFAYDMVIDSALPIEYGYTEQTLGILFAVLPLIGAIGAALYERYEKQLSNRNILISVSFFISAVISGINSLFTGTATVAFRSFAAPMITVHASNEINQVVDSKYRATTISTFTMFQKLPYILTAFFIGDLIDRYGATNLSLILGLVFLACYSITVFFKKISVRSRMVMPT